MNPQASSRDEAPANVPQTTPTAIGYGHPEYQFVQAIMEMQKSLGEINASIATLNRTVDSTKSKVDELVNWKNRILGGAMVLGAVFAVLGFVFSKAGDYIYFKGKDESVQVQALVPTQPAASTSIPPPKR